MLSLSMPVRAKGIRFLILLSLWLSAWAGAARAEVIDAVVASVGREAITLSELAEAHDRAQALDASVTRAQTLNTLVNRALLLQEARKMRLDTPDDEALLREYINLRLRSLISIRDRDARAFFDENRAKFEGRGFPEVRPEIETYLLEREVNARLRLHLEELREKADISIMLKD